MLALIAGIGKVDGDCVLVWKGVAAEYLSSTYTGRRLSWTRLSPYHHPCA